MKLVLIPISDWSENILDYCSLQWKASTTTQHRISNLFMFKNMDNLVNYCWSCVDNACESPRKQIFHHTTFQSNNEYVEISTKSKLNSHTFQFAGSNSSIRNLNMTVNEDKENKTRNTCLLNKKNCCNLKINLEINILTKEMSPSTPRSREFTCLRQRSLTPMNLKMRSVRGKRIKTTKKTWLLRHHLLQK